MVTRTCHNLIFQVDRSAVPIPMPHKQSVSKPTPKVEEVSTIDGKVKIGEDGTVSIYQKNGKVSHIIGMLSITTLNLVEIVIFSGKRC